jgi:hypothetical protein
MQRVTAALEGPSPAATTRAPTTRSEGSQAAAAAPSCPPEHPSGPTNRAGASSSSSSTQRQGQGQGQGAWLNEQILSQLGKLKPVPKEERAERRPASPGGLLSLFQKGASHLRSRAHGEETAGSSSYHDNTGTWS